jgi:hypothetical protein
MFWMGITGTLMACAGCGLITSNRLDLLRPAQLLLAAAWLILVPLFAYLVVVRSRASAAYKRRQKKRAEREQAELDALAAVGSEFQVPGSSSSPRSEK